MAGSLFQNSYYVVNILDAILYGIVLVLYVQTVVKILEMRTRSPTDKFMMVFSTVLLIMNTIYWTTQAYFGQMMWVVHSDYPGGADAYWRANGSVWYQTWGIVASVVCNLMSDALLAWRCYVIWNSRRVVILPALLWLASLAFSVGLLYGSGKPNGDYFGGIAVVFVTAYTASTFAFNVLVTCLICGRIIYIGRCMQSCYPADARLYTGAVAAVVESALPFTVFSGVYLVTYAIGSDVANAFSFYAMFTCISPLMIILRVLSKRAWTRESGTRFTTTISYRGQTDYVTVDGADLEEKRATDADVSFVSSAEYGARPPEVDTAPEEMDITSLPV
ncbi:hypothetical protein C8Q80DRAFT_1219953 [Daedaleopsis nitida]|nr:hypothetical protein C8Q80DRAFT_1219953 [Daedaleopsis nitida]